MPVLLIDNYDSFVFNLARYVEELGYEALVRRHDALTVADARTLAPSHIIISPGPLGPDDTGVSREILRELGSEVPTLGVCLGHQCMAAVHGGRVVRAAPVHGHVWPIHHAGAGIFDGLARPFAATRYHSLVVEPSTLPETLIPLAWTATEFTAAQADALPWRPDEPGTLLMAFAHRTLPQVGLQFHPESVGSENGHALLARFLAAGERFHRHAGDWQPTEQPRVTS